MRLALGTVQFGLRYGIANTAGQVPPQEIALILETARTSGINTLDTAIAYGDSESRLGGAGVTDFRIVSKLPGLDGRLDTIGTMVQGALDRLGVSTLHGLLLHRSEDLCGSMGDDVYAALLDLKQRGLVRKIGVSIYDPAELDAIVPRFDIDLVQAPFNVLDRRLATSGWLERLKQAEVEVHTRSALLQGLLVMTPEQRPAYFQRWAELWAIWDAWLAETGTTPLAAALAFVLAEAGIDRVLVGVDTDLQLRDILRVANDPGAPIPSATLATYDTDLINPARWNSK